MGLPTRSPRGAEGHVLEDRRRGEDTLGNVVSKFTGVNLHQILIFEAQASEELSRVPPRPVIRQPPLHPPHDERSPFVRAPISLPVVAALNNEVGVTYPDICVCDPALTRS